MSEGESSGQALERFITAQLEALSLTVPSDDVEFMARFVEEDMEKDEKLEGVRGMLEGVVEGVSYPVLALTDVQGELPESGVDEALEAMVGEWERLKAEEEAAAAAEEEDDSPTPPDHEAIMASLTEEELKAARKAALLRQYAYVEGGPDEMDRDANAPPRGQAQAESEAKKAAEERRKLVEAALMRDSRKKKKHRKVEIDDPLQWENLNREKVAMKAQMAREEAKRGAQEKKDRDRAALEKQR